MMVEPPLIKFDLLYQKCLFIFIHDLDLQCAVALKGLLDFDRDVLIFAVVVFLRLVCVCLFLVDYFDDVALVQIVSQHLHLVL